MWTDYEGSELSDSKIDDEFKVSKWTYEDGTCEYVAGPEPAIYLGAIGVGDTEEEAIKSLLNAILAYMQY